MDNNTQGNHNSDDNTVISIATKASLGANRMVGFDKPTVWSVFSPLSIQYNSINLVTNTIN